MLSVYEKDLSKLKLILLITILLSISLIGYSYSYNTLDENKDYYLTTIYNTGKYNCQLTRDNQYNLDDGTGVECFFSVMGYNNTNKDLVYKIYISDDKNNNIDGKYINLSLYKKNKYLLSFNGKNIENRFYQEVVINKNSEFYDEYKIKMWFNDYESINFDLSDKFIVNVDVSF